MTPADYKACYRYLLKVTGLTDADIESAMMEKPGSKPGNNLRNSGFPRKMKQVVKLLQLFTEAGQADAPWTKCPDCGHLTPDNAPGTECARCGVTLDARVELSKWKD